MCCIFTWLAWAFDATHRVVVFVMACCITTSLCCMLFTASLAGVAMGYNYSLAEYIDLKETNISVYIKRGVYDDEISDDFDWRRSGGEEPNLFVKDSGLKGVEGGQPLAPGRRRMPDSVFESDDQNKYEGSLMRLTSMATPLPLRRFQPEPPYTTSSTTTKSIVDGLLAVADSLPGGSLDRLKAIQAAARHHEAKKIELATAQFPEDASERIKVIQANAQIHDARRNDPSTTTDKYAKYFNQLAQHPGFPGSGLSNRKFMESQQKDIETMPPNRFRDAVFRGQLVGWPTTAPTKTTNGNFFEYNINFDISTLTPPTVKPLLVRPESATRALWQTTQADPPRPIIRTKQQEVKEVIYDSPKQKSEEAQQKARGDNDYDESHGLPSRKKRSNGEVSEDIILFNNNKFGTYQNDLHNVPQETELRNSATTVYPIHAKSHAKNISSVDFIKESSKIFPKTKLEQMKDYESQKNKNISNAPRALNNTFNGNIMSILIEQSVTKNLEYATSSGESKKVKLSNPRTRRKRSKGYEYKKRENMQTKSIWWKIRDGTLEQWNRIIMYLDNRISEAKMVINSTEPAKIQNKDRNSSQSPYAVNFSGIPTRKITNEAKLDINGTNTKTNLLETLTVVDI